MFIGLSTGRSARARSEIDLFRYGKSVIDLITVQRLRSSERAISLHSDRPILVGFFRTVSRRALLLAFNNARPASSRAGTCHGGGL
jgi:hypothetical protein